jgi:hypothetical protein
MQYVITMLEINNNYGSLTNQGTKRNCARLILMMTVSMTVSRTTALCKDAVCIAVGGMLLQRRWFSTSLTSSDESLPLNAEDLYLDDRSERSPRRVLLKKPKKGSEEPYVFRYSGIDDCEHLIKKDIGPVEFKQTMKQLHGCDFDTLVAFYNKFSAAIRRLESELFNISNADYAFVKKIRDGTMKEYSVLKSLFHERDEKEQYWHMYKSREIAVTLLNECTGYMSKRTQFVYESTRTLSDLRLKQKAIFRCMCENYHYTNKRKNIDPIAKDKKPNQNTVTQVKIANNVQKPPTLK